MPPTLLRQRAVVRLSPLEEGESVAAFLQGLLTNDVTGLPDHAPAYAGLLSPQGKTLFDLLAWGSGPDILLDCEAATASELVKRLSLYRLRRRIAIAPDDGLAVHWSPGAAEGASPDPRLAGLGYRWLGAVEAGTADAADEAWLAHRLEQGVPEGRAELHDILWLETNAAELNGVSFTKGCYIGQENTARMNWRGKVNRRLVVVPLEQSDPNRQRIAYPQLGLAVDHRRIEDLAALPLPAWQAEALTSA